MKLPHRSWVLCIAFLVLAVPAVAAGPKAPVEAFSRLPRLTDVQLSPDGKHLAYLMNEQGLSIVVTQTIGKDDPRFLVRCENEERRIRWFRWASNDWLLVSVSFANWRYGVPTTETRLVRIRREGSDPVLLVKPGLDTRHVSQFQDGVVSYLPDDPEHILLELDEEQATYASVYRVNLDTGAKRIVKRTHPPILSWRTDQQDRIRLGHGYDDGVVSVHLQGTEKKKWRVLWRHETINEAGTEVMGFDADPDILYVRELHNGRNAVFSVDTSDPALPRKLMAYDPDYDIEGNLIYSPKSRDVVGVYDRGADGSRIYWDDSYAGLQKAVDAALPDTTNLLATFSRDERRYIAYSFSDVEPGTFYYGNRDTGDLNPFGKTYPELSAHELSGKQAVSYEARDGLTIEGYLTPPWGKRPQPWAAIVLPHGGPHARDYGQFDYLTEFLASRGYAVLQMNFRGSSGYGWDFLSSAYKDLGGKMQDDVTDGARWLIEEGLADPERICILGGSYGGYAALWGAVKTPELYRCAVSVNGVSDWGRVLSDSARYVAGETTQEQLGKRSKLKQVSPLRRAGEIRIPVLLVHGESDRVVPVGHSRKMAKSLRKLGKEYRYVELENGTHSIENQRNRTLFLEAVESFLSEHLANPASARRPSP